MLDSILWLKCHCPLLVYIYVAGKLLKWRFDRIPKVDDQITQDVVKITTLWGDFPKESK